MAKDFDNRLGALEDFVRSLARGTKQNVKLEREGAKRPAVAPVQPRRGEWWVGDEGTTTELLETVRGMLTGHAKTFREVVEATGAGEDRLKGVLVRLQRDGSNLVNLGNQSRALWAILTPEAYARVKAAMTAARKRR